MITSQTNTTLEGIADALLEHDAFYVCGHIHPDGDCIGSTLGLTWALRSLGREAAPLLASGDETAADLSFMPLSDELTGASSLDLDEIPEGAVFITVDAPNAERIGEAAAKVRGACSLTITIDHHAHPIRESDLSYTDPDATSTTCIIWELCKLLGFDAESQGVSDLATCLYVGLCTDSGRFMNSNTDASAFHTAFELVSAGADPASISERLFLERSFESLEMDAAAVRNAEEFASAGGIRCVLSHVSAQEMEAAGATYDDLDDCINVLKSIGGSQVICMLKECDGAVRGSFRAKDGTDVSALARSLGGGGHKAAAGFDVKDTLDGARERVRALMSGIGESDSDEVSS